MSNLYPFFAKTQKADHAMKHSRVSWLQSETCAAKIGKEFSAKFVIFGFVLKYLERPVCSFYVLDCSSIMTYLYCSVYYSMAKNVCKSCSEIRGRYSDELFCALSLNRERAVFFYSLMLLLENARAK